MVVHLSERYPLPDDLLLWVCSYLCPADLSHCFRVSHQWRRAATETLLTQWTKLSLTLSRHSTEACWGRNGSISASSGQELKIGSHNLKAFIFYLDTFGWHLNSLDLIIKGLDMSRLPAWFNETLVPVCQNLRQVSICSDTVNQEIVQSLTSLLRVKTDQSQPRLKLISSPLIGCALLHLLPSSIRLHSLVFSDDSESDLNLIVRNSLLAQTLTVLELQNYDGAENGNLDLQSFSQLQFLQLFRNSNLPIFPLRSALSTLLLYECSNVDLAAVSLCFPQLKVLEICHCNDIRVTPLLEYIPLLRSLIIFRFRGGGWDFRWSLGELAALLVRCCPQIRALNVGGISASPVDDARHLSDLLRAIFNQSPRRIASSLVIDVGFSSGDVCGLGAAILTAFGASKIAVQPQRFAEMHSANRLWVHSLTHSKAAVVVLSDLASVREQFWVQCRSAWSFSE